MNNFFVIDNETGVVVNAIAYDGEAPYQEPGCFVIPQTDAPTQAWIGWCLTTAGWVAPEPNPDEPNPLNPDPAP